MLNKVLIIARDTNRARATAACLKPEWPDVGASYYDPAARGLPGPGFDWTPYQLVLLDDDLGLDGQSGLQWLAALCARPGFPPAIYIDSSGSERAAVRALKAGATDYISRRNLTAGTLAEAMRESVPQSLGPAAGEQPQVVPEAAPVYWGAEPAAGADGHERTMVLRSPPPAGDAAPVPQTPAAAQDDLAKTQLLELRRPQTPDAPDALDQTMLLNSKTAAIQDQPAPATSGTPGRTPGTPTKGTPGTPTKANSGTTSRTPIKATSPAASGTPAKAPAPGAPGRDFAAAERPLDRTQLMRAPPRPGAESVATGGGAAVEKQPKSVPSPPGAGREEPGAPPAFERRSPDRAPDIAPIKVPGYRVLRAIGAGAMARVYVGHRRSDGHVVVLKIMRIQDDADPRLLRRFLREYQLLRDVEHPNVVRIFDRITANEYACLAMEYCAGGDLTQRIAMGGLDASVALEYLRQAALGLSVAHEHGVVHRDLKPGNILFRKDGTLAVADFGVSARLGESRITHQSEMVGTPYYLSPEQIHGGEVDHRGDLYALGIILYEMLTGVRPYVSQQLSKLIDLHLNAAPPQLPKHHAQLQPLLEGLLAKSLDERFQSAEEVIAALELNN